MKPLSRLARASFVGSLFALLLDGATLPAFAAENRSDAQPGSLTREEAVQIIKTEFEARKVKGSRGLNDKDLGGMAIGEQPVYFEYLADKKTLRLHALIYRFRRAPRPGVLDGYYKEEKSGTDTGGGKVEFQTENGGVYLSRSYTGRVDPTQFHADIEKLANAATNWSAEVIPNIARKVTATSK